MITILNKYVDGEKAASVKKLNNLLKKLGLKNQIRTMLSVIIPVTGNYMVEHSGSLYVNDGLFMQVLTTGSDASFSVCRHMLQLNKDAILSVTGTMLVCHQF